MSAEIAPNARQGLPLAVKLVVTALSVPLARMELVRSSFPFIHYWFDDFGYGLMVRLGLTFGLVVLVWHVRSLREMLTVRCAAFWLASIASALLATWVGKRAGSDYDLLAIVISGAVLLALAQKLILGCSWIQAVAAMVAAPGLFYLIALPLSKVVSEESAVGKLLFNYWPLYWQLGYLLGMFGVLALITKRAHSSSPGDH